MGNEPDSKEESRRDKINNKAGLLCFALLCSDGRRYHGKRRSKNATKINLWACGMQISMTNNARETADFLSRHQLLREPIKMIKPDEEEVKTVFKDIVVVVRTKKR